ALVDMQRQCGFPALFKTMAPWEHCFPYHLFVLDEMEKGGRGRMQLAGLETLHTAQVFTELNRGLYSGRNKTSAQDGWKDHLLASTQPEEGRVKTVINYFQRLEFQDGKRKLPTQNVEHIGLERKLAATVPDVAEQPALRGYMLGRPHGRSDSGWPVEDGESRWDPDENIVRLRHTEADKKQGHRAFFPETLEVTKGLLLRYVATYTPKFSDSFAREWLNDEASAFSVARRVLFDYQPAEPEMWLYLYAQQMPPCRYGGPMVPLIAPWPGMEMACDTVSLFNDRWFGQWLALRQPFRKLSDLLLNDVVEK
ncbi:Pif1, partial [Symbiodinium pilosum]